MRVIEMTCQIGLLTSRTSARLVSSSDRVSVETPFGMGDLLIGKISGRDVACIDRYGPDLNRPSHKIDYRANIWALRSIGVERLISQNAIGSLRESIRPGDIVVPHDFLDRTHQRPLSLFDDQEAWVRVDLSLPFCPELRAALSAGVSSVSARLLDGGVFACVEGPRLETPAEVRALRHEGADIIGTPLVPEAVFAREAEMCFASIAPVINFAAGIVETVSHSGMSNYYYNSGLHEQVEDAISVAVTKISEERLCVCGHALADSYVGERPPWLEDWHMES